MSAAVWQQDKRWSDRFLPEIKRLLGEHLIQEAPYEEDTEHNTDLIVLKLDSVRIACRVRRHKYLDRFGDEFTIRNSRPSGAKTELTKIVEGWGNYMFYGFSDAEEVALARWVLGDLNVFRLWFNRQLYKLPPNTLPGNGQSNPDGSSDFSVFRLEEMPSAFFVGQGGGTRPRMSTCSDIL